RRGRIAPGLSCARTSSAAADPASSTSGRIRQQHASRSARAGRASIRREICPLNRNVPALGEVVEEGGNARKLRAPGVGRLAQQSGLDRGIDAARAALLQSQSASGSWLFELEADCTIPAEYILMMHYLDEIDPVLQTKLAVYLRSHQAEHGGWPLYHGGRLDISCSVKAYFALKLAGDSPDEPHMRRARAAILERGGAARSNVFTRIALALFGQVPWRAVPYIPVEIMLLPRWFPFHLDKVSYWSRTVMVPLLVLCTLGARAVNPSGVGIAELFTVPPERERHYFRRRGIINQLFLLLDRVGRIADAWVPSRVRAHAIGLA